MTMKPTEESPFEGLGPTGDGSAGGGKFVPPLCRFQAPFGQGRLCYVPMEPRWPGAAIARQAPFARAAEPALRAFLGRCEFSSIQCYEQFKSLLMVLERNPVRGRRFLARLIDEVRGELSESECLARFHFSFTTTHIGDECEPITLLQLPSTFAPEEWSTTFLKGLLRAGRREFDGKHIVELGCGTGWISIALLLQAQPALITGLDVNPRAVVCSSINAYVNLLLPDGSFRTGPDRKPFIERIRFMESDLLQAIRDEQSRVDRIVACIPQVLNPHETTLSAAEHDCDHVLHDLSNYTDKQGLPEDEFGLGLVARALDESLGVLAEHGKLFLNLAGRPGSHAIQTMFDRRGFAATPVWETLVRQAGDTDITRLVQVETETGHSFEFFGSREDARAVTATVARALLRRGAAVFHSLTVYDVKSHSHDAVQQVSDLST